MLGIGAIGTSRIERSNARSAQLLAVKSPRAFGRPVWRGRMHAGAFLVAIPAGILLTVSAERPIDRVAAGVYAATVVALFGTSAAYHLFTTCERSRSIMQRLDHSMIFVLIIGTYTPLCLVALPPSWGVPFLGIVGAVGVLGIVLKLVAFERAQKLSWSLYPVMGWSSVIVAPVLINHLTGAQIALIVGGGVAYSMGLPVLLAKRPNPWPDRFGYHEIWHALTIVAASLHFVAISDVLI